MKAVIESVFFVSLVLAIVGIPAAVIWNTVAADGKVTACYIRESRVVGKQQFALMGDIDWRDDPYIGWFNTQDDARALRVFNTSCLSKI